MMLAVLCPHCSKSYRMPEGSLGHKATCKACGQSFTLTMAADETAGAASPPKADQPPDPVPAGQTPSASRARDSGDLGAPRGYEVPTKIGRFEVRGLLGTGGFGVVYRAHDPLLARDVALKVPHGVAFETEEGQARLLREPRAAAQLRHQNIVPIHEAGFDGPRFYIAYSLIEGQTLKAVMERGPLEPREAARIVARLADALDHAHQQGIVHRDVKPANVILDGRGEPHLTDFGLARLVDSSTQLTQQGMLLGTPAYMSPEQAGAPVGEVGPASDQYSLGATLYELLCGEPPFTGQPMVVLYRARSDAPPPPRTRNPAVSPELEAICLRALAKSPGQRFATVGEMAAALEQYLRRPTARPPRIVKRHVRMPRLFDRMPRRPWAVGSAILAAILGLLLFFAFLFRPTDGPPEETPVTIASGPLAPGRQAGPNDSQQLAPVAPSIAPPAATPTKLLTLEALPDIQLEAGKQRVISVSVDRGDYVGPIDIALEGLPFGVAADAGTIAAGRDSTLITLLPDAGVVAGEAAVRVVATAGDARIEELVRMVVAAAIPAVQWLSGSQPGEERDDNGLAMKFCWCPPGTFTMGSPPGEPNRSADEDQVQATLTRGFWLGKFEVTQSQWESVMGTTFNEQRSLAGGDPNHPMHFVNHDEATQFCAKLTADERAAGRLAPGTEYRLPTEAQWEYACRAGTTTATAFGDSLSSTQANIDGDYPYNGGAKGPNLGRTTEVGQYSANDWGLCDMHGNVWEWCRDWYGSTLPGGSDPEVREPASSRVLRGGAWIFIGQYCRSASRGGNAGPLIVLQGCRVALVQSIVAAAAPSQPPVPPPTEPAAVQWLAGSQPGDERDDNALKIKFCWCPPGTFTMGGPPRESNRGADEDQVQATLTRGFWLGKFEVTQAQWESVMGTTFDEQGALANRDPPHGSGPNHPMYFVNHDEATQFCAKLTADEQAAGRLLAGTEYRLPTEAQWEYACRAGTTTAMAFGDSLSSTQANFDGDEPYNGGAKGPELGQTAKVGQYPANAWGLCDMHGNVWEWCRDWYGSTLPGGSDPEVTEPASLRVLRGGDWSASGLNCRSAFRGRNDPANRNSVLGFRVALVPLSK